MQGVESIHPAPVHWQSQGLLPYAPASIRHKAASRWPYENAHLSAAYGVPAQLSLAAQNDACDDAPFAKGLEKQLHRVYLAIVDDGF